MIQSPRLCRGRREIANQREVLPRSERCGSPREPLFPCRVAILEIMLLLPPPIKESMGPFHEQGVTTPSLYSITYDIAIQQSGPSSHPFLNHDVFDAGFQLARTISLVSILSSVSLYYWYHRTFVHGIQKNRMKIDAWFKFWFIYKPWHWPSHLQISVIVQVKLPISQTFCCLNQVQSTVSNSTRVRLQS